MPGAHGWRRWRFLVSPKWLGWHLFVVLAVLGMLALGDWQYHRAVSGNPLSWAYTFEWPFFAILGIVFWIKTIRDELNPPAIQRGPSVALPVAAGGTVLPGPAFPADGEPGVAADEEDEDGEPSAEDRELAAYNAYLARLHREVRGHG